MGVKKQSDLVTSLVLLTLLNVACRMFMVISVNVHQVSREMA